MQRLPFVELLTRFDIHVHCNEEIRLELLVVHFEQLFGGEHRCCARGEAIDEHSVVGLFWCHVQRISRGRPLPGSAIRAAVYPP